MTTRKPPESEPPASGKALSAHADDWIRQFTKHLELNFLDAGSGLPADAGIAEARLATARAVLATFVDSGMDLESALGLLGQAAVEGRAGDVGWSEALNGRRFALIDKDVQGTLTPAERSNWRV